MPGALAWVVVGFRAVHRCCSLGCCFPLSPSSLRCLHCVGLRQFGEREGLPEQRALGRNLVALRVLPTLQNGVSVLGSRWGGVSLFCARFALALRLLSRLRLFLFEARLSGVREGGGVKGVNPGFLVLAFSTGTLKGSGVPARPVQGGGFCASMLALVCSTPACPWALGRRAFSCGPPLLRFGVLLSSQQESPRR